MSDFSRKEHWEKIYQTKQPDEVSWYQPVPETSLAFFREYSVPKTAAIIDVGGGDSFLVDHLLELGYKNLTVLDISAAALERANKRLGKKADKVKWIVADAASFNPPEKYDFWHDRATFHFLTKEHEIEQYVETLQKSINTAGIVVIGTFSENGPEKCSGIKIRQYSEDTLAKRLHGSFDKIRCLTVDHQTPFETTQNFVFCSFRKTSV